jgi:folate-dependent phosphoribosylglycinamide formyltransferase PurN
MSEPLRVGVLASGRGSNFRALAEAGGRIPAAVVVLVTDRAGAGALAVAH